MMLVVGIHRLLLKSNRIMDGVKSGNRGCWNGGLSALLSMLNSSASGVSVVNIDKTFVQDNRQA